MLTISPAEIVFWVSLFGLDFGAPLMLPERWRFQAGAIVTTLSFAGLMWSVGYAPTVPNHRRIETVRCVRIDCQLFLCGRQARP